VPSSPPTPTASRPASRRGRRHVQRPPTAPWRLQPRHNPPPQERNCHDARAHRRRYPPRRPSGPALDGVVRRADPDHEPDGTTALRGALEDQAQLHGVLARVRDLGANLISALLTGNNTTRALRPSTDAPRTPSALPPANRPESPTNAQPRPPPQE